MIYHAWSTTTMSIRLSRTWTWTMRSWSCRLMANDLSSTTWNSWVTIVSMKISWRTSTTVKVKSCLRSSMITSTYDSWRLRARTALRCRKCTCRARLVVMTPRFQRNCRVLGEGRRRRASRSKKQFRNRLGWTGTIGCIFLRIGPRHQFRSKISNRSYLVVSVHASGSFASTSYPWTESNFWTCPSFAGNASQSSPIIFNST